MEETKIKKRPAVNSVRVLQQSMSFKGIVCMLQLQVRHGVDEWER